MAQGNKEQENYENVNRGNENTSKEVHTQNKYSLPYGLCAKYGIYLSSNATPTDAWNALKGVGIKPSDVYKDLQEDGKVDIKPTGEKVVESKSKTKKLLKEGQPKKAKTLEEEVKDLTPAEKAQILYDYNKKTYGVDIANQSNLSVSVAADTFDMHYGTHQALTEYVNNYLGFAGENGGESKENDTSLKTETKTEKQESKVFAHDAYTKKRKSNALNSEDPKVYDKMARKKTFETWKNLTLPQKEAVVDYTSSYSKYNEPLRGIEYGTSKYKGEGNVDLETIGMSYGGYKKGEIKKRIDALTNAINQSSYDKDVVLRRGTNYTGMDNFFKGVSMDTLKYGTQAELEKALIGNTYSDGGFMSCGSTKGKGFSGNIKFSIYAPKGTKMLYVEPVSSYGAKYGVNWQGQEQTSFNHENETILQRGSSFRVTEVKRFKDGNMYVRMEVVNQKEF